MKRNYNLKSDLLRDPNPVDRDAPAPYDSVLRRAAFGPRQAFMIAFKTKKGSVLVPELTVLGLFLFLTLTMTYPLVFHLGSTVPSDIGDPLYTIWAMNWEMKQALHGFGQFFNGNNFFPHTGTLLYADYIPGLALLGAPFALLTGSMIAAYNILFLASFLLCAWGAYRLVLYLTRDRSAAFVAGLIFAFFNYRFAHLSHLELLFFGWMPLFFLSLFKWADRPVWRYAFGMGVYFVLQTWCCAYYGAYFAPFAALGTIYIAAKTNAVRRPGFWRSAAALALVAVPLLVAFYLPFVLVHDKMSFSRNLDEVLRYSAQFQFFTSIARGTLFWGFLLPSQESSEWILYPGFVAVLLALAGAVFYAASYRREVRAERKTAFVVWDAFLFWALLLGLQIHKPQGKPGELQWGALPIVLAVFCAARFFWAWRKRTTDGTPAPTSSLAVRFFLFTVFFAFLLSLGPVARLNDRPLFTGPYLLFLKFIPGFQGLRAPGRIVVIMMLAAAVLAGWAIARLMSRIRRRALRFGLVGLIALLVLADYAQRPIPLAQVPLGDRISAIYQNVRALPDSAVLIELPMPSLSWIQEDWRNVLPMYFSMIHGKRTANGHSGYYPPGYTVLRDAMEEFPVARTLKLLRDLGIDHILIHTRAHRADDGLTMLKALAGLPDQAEPLASADGDYLFRLKPAAPEPQPTLGREVANRNGWLVTTKTNRQQARLAVDGNLDSGWTSKGTQSAGEFVLIDLTAEAEVGQIELLQGGDPFGYPRAFVIEGSLNKTEWFDLAVVPVGVPDVTAATIEDFRHYKMLIAFPPRVVRYIRIQLTAFHRTMHWSIQELNVRR